jgi:hypothetical protein
MRRLLLMGTAVLVLTAAPATAQALPAPDLCTPDATRGGVSADFVIDACVDATSITLRNDLEQPVLVHRTGDVGAPGRVHERGSADASVLRLLSGVDELLMPGDVTRWPLGATDAAVIVVDVDPVTLSVVDTLTARLPELGTGDKGAGAVATVVREVIAALHERTACASGKNFLRTTACNVDAAARISRALRAQFPRSTGARLVPIALDQARWIAWSAAATPARSDAGPRSAAVASRILTIAAVPPPAVVPPAVAPPPPVAATAPVPTRPRVPAPAVPAAPPVAAAAPAPVPAPTANHSLSDWWAATLQRLAAQNTHRGTGHDTHQGHG